MAAGAPVVADDQRVDSNFMMVNEAYPGVTRVSQMPPIWAVEDFLTGEECDTLIGMGRDNPEMKRSIVVDGRAGKTSAPTRTSSSCFLKKAPCAWLLRKVELLTGRPHPTHEPPQVCKYESGQFYRAHFDAFDVTTGPGRECALTGGQRVGTVLIYLNDVAAGGGTLFSSLPGGPRRFLPKRGRAVVFCPCDLGGNLDRLALHQGEDAVDQKWVSQVWLRQAPFGHPFPRVPLPAAYRPAVARAVAAAQEQRGAAAAAGGSVPRT